MNLNEAKSDITSKVKNYLDDAGRLRIFPSKKKNKLLTLAYLASKFEQGVIYTQKEIDETIDHFHTFNDHCLLRREMYDNHFLNRENNGSVYWLEESSQEDKKDSEE